MNTINGLGQHRLAAWLGLSHLLTAGVAAVFVSLAPSNWTAAGRLTAGIVLGLAAGLLLNLPLRNAVAIAEAAMAKLAGGPTIAALPTGWQRRWGPLARLLGSIDTLVERERELAHLRENLVRSTGLAAAQAERNRLARDLHDSIKQQLYAINASAAAALARWETDLAGAHAAVEDVRRAAQAALAEMAALLQQLRPAPLAAAGLLDALREQCEALAHRSGAEVTVDLGQPGDAAAYTAAVDTGRLPPGAEEAIFRIAQEALNNIARHARASHVALRLRVGGETLRLEISDDGQGFAVQESIASGQAPAGYGLSGMRDRAAAIGAGLDLVSESGRGTRVSVSLPLAPPVAQKESEMSAEVKSWLQKASLWQSMDLAAGGLTAVFALGLIPRLAGGSGLASLVSLVLMLVGLAVTVVLWARSRAAALRVTVALGEEHPVVWRMRREAAASRVWAALVATVILPGALMPKSWPEFPIAALAVGIACAGLAAVTIVLSYRATEGFWTAAFGQRPGHRA